MFFYCLSVENEKYHHVYFCTDVLRRWCVTCRWGHEASRVGSSSSGSNSGFSLGGRVRKIFTEIYFFFKEKEKEKKRQRRTEKVAIMRQKRIWTKWRWMRTASAADSQSPGPTQGRGWDGSDRSETNKEGGALRSERTSKESVLLAKATIRTTTLFMTQFAFNSHAAKTPSGLQLLLETSE